MEKTAYCQFFGDVPEFRANSLMQFVSYANKEEYQHIHISISSTGGSNYAALTLYNFLRNTSSCKITTHNVGCCESAANIIFLAGTERIASPFSRFLIHETKSKLLKDMLVSKNKLLELYNGLISDETMVKQIFIKEADIDEITIEKWIEKGIIINPEEAKTAGIITSIADFAPELGVEIFVVPMEQPT